jgi:hypothetical protein
MTTTDVAILQALSKPLYGFVNDDVVAGGPAAVTTQAGATPIRGAIVRVTGGISNSSLVLPSMLTNDAPDMIFVVNRMATNACVVFCALGESLNGATNGSLSIAALGFGLFLFKKRGDSPVVVPDWRAAAFT